MMAAAQDPVLARHLLRLALAATLLLPASAARAQVVGVAPLRTLYVDHDSRGGACRDTYTATENAAASPLGSKPWCTIGAAGRNAIAGDLILVRGGTYSERMACGGRPACAGWAVLELVKKGTAAHPIVYQARQGETPIIDPAGQQPGVNTGLIYGILAGSTVPVGVCTAGSRKDLDCYSDTECPSGGPSACDKGMAFYTIIDGFKIQNWSFYDPRPSATNANHTTSQYGMVIRNAGASIPTDITVRNAEFVNNHGAGALHAYGAARITFEYNKIHANHTHGWTSAMDFWLSNGKIEGQNVIRGNTIYDNEDDPPIFCLSNYCAGSTQFKNRCEFDKWTNKATTVLQGFGCACGANSQCQSGQCVVRDCSAATGGCECAGDTEGHGIILDVSGSRGAFLIESNVFYNNEGACISVFKSDNVTARNNTCWNNNIRPGSTEIVAFTNKSGFYNNIIVPRAGHRGIGLYFNTFVYAVDPTTLREGFNIIWSRDRADVFEWGFGHSGALAQYLTEVAANNPPLSLGASTLNVSPQLADGEVARDFRPLPGSPALNSADRVHLAPADVTAGRRVTADRGAFAGSTTPLAPPVLLSVDPLCSLDGAVVSGGGLLRLGAE